MSNSSLANSLADRIKPVEDSQWGDSVEAMHNYLTLVKKNAEIKAEKAEEKAEEHQEDLDALKQKRRKRRNYGTRTGIALENDTSTSFPVK